MHDLSVFSESDSSTTPSTLSTATPGQFLRKALDRKKNARSKVSLRWLGNKLGLSPTMTSQIFNDQRAMPLAKIESAVRWLGLDATEAQYLRLLIELAASRSSGVRSMIVQALEALRIEARSREAEEISVPVLLGEWQVLAVLAAFDVDGFNGREETLADILRIPLTQARSSLKRLASQNVVEEKKSGSGQWRLCRQDDLLFNSVLPNEDFRRYYVQLNRLSQAHILSDERPKKSATGALTFALDPSDIPLAQIEIGKFTQRMNALAGKSKTRSRVYSCLVHCFPLLGETSDTKL